MTLRMAICGLMLLAAISVAWAGGPRSQRSAIVATGAILILNWMLYVTAWIAPAWSLANLAWTVTGIDVQPREMWALVDAVSASAIVLIGLTIQSGSEKWCLALWTLLMSQIMTHALVKTGAIEAGASLEALDFLFYGQLAVYLFIGRKGVGDVVRRMLSRYVSRPSAAHSPNGATSSRSQSR